MRDRSFESKVSVSARHAPQHAAEHRVGSVLQGKVEIGQNLAALGDHLDQLVGKIHRIQVHQPNPDDAFDLFEFAQQFGQARLAIEIHAVVGRVLSHDHEFAHSVGRQLAGLGEHFFHGLGRVLAAHLGNRAKRAKPVATLGNFQIREMPRSDSQTIAIGKRPDRRRLKYQPLFVESVDESIGDFGHLLSAKHADQVVDVRAAVEQGLLFALGEATGNDHAAGAAAPLEREHFFDRPERFIARPLDESAGVDDHEVGSLGLRRQAIAVELQQAEHALAIDQIFRAAEADKRIASLVATGAGSTLGGGTGGLDDRQTCHGGGKPWLGRLIQSGEISERAGASPPTPAIHREGRRLLFSSMTPGSSHARDARRASATPTPSERHHLPPPVGASKANRQVWESRRGIRPSRYLSRSPVEPRALGGVGSASKLCC